jgi:hypothetical protein
VRSFFDDALADLTTKRIQLGFLKNRAKKRKPTPQEIRKYGLRGAKDRIEKMYSESVEATKRLESEIERESEALVKALRPHAERFLLNLIYLPVDYYPYAKKHIRIVQKYLPFNGDDPESQKKRAAMAASNVESESGYSDNDYRVLLGILPEPGDTVDPAHKEILRGATTVGRDDRMQHPVKKYIFKVGDYKRGGVLPIVHRYETQKGVPFRPHEAKLDDEALHRYLKERESRFAPLDFETRIHQYVTRNLSFRGDEAKKKFYAKMIRLLNESRSEANNRRAIYLATRIGLLSKNEDDRKWAEHYSKFTDWRDGANRFRSELHYTPNIPVIKNILAGKLDHITQGFDFNELKGSKELSRAEQIARSKNRRELEKDPEVRPRIPGGIAGRKLIGTPTVTRVAPGKRVPELPKESSDLDF